MGEGRRDRTRWPSAPTELYSRQAFVRPEVPEVGLAHFFYASSQCKTFKMTSSSSFKSSTPSLTWSPSSSQARNRCASSSTIPSGVDLALCEKVTKHLNHLRAEYSLEVSSPGPKYSNHKEPQ